MAQVVFYTEVADRRRFLYSFLLNKMLPKQLRVYVAVSSEAEAVKMDNYLWTARAGDFLPHSRFNEISDDASPVIIGINAPPENFNADVMVWGLDAPAQNFNQFKYLVEIVDGRTKENNVARERYKYYKTQGYEINVHKINKNV